MPASMKMPSAQRAATVALHLNTAGVLIDLLPNGAYTCLDARVEVIEHDEFDGRPEERGWDEYDAADFAYDLRGDH